MTVATLSRVEFERPTDYQYEVAARADRVRMLTIPDRSYLTIEGTALPGSEGFTAAIGTLFPVAYTLHFALKRRAIEAPVGVLEGLYWIEDERPLDPEQFRALPDSRVAWTWRLLMPLPDAAADEDVSTAIDDVRAKRRPALLGQLHVRRWEEGQVAQVMHVGPYATEPTTIDRLHAAIAAAGLRPRGCHHEIYIGDPNRAKPERLKTLIRQPVEPVSG